MGSERVSLPARSLMANAALSPLWKLLSGRVFMKGAPRMQAVRVCSVNLSPDSAHVGRLVLFVRKSAAFSGLAELGSVAPLSSSRKEPLPADGNHVDFPVDPVHEDGIVFMA